MTWLIKFFVDVKASVKVLRSFSSLSYQLHMSTTLHSVSSVNSHAYTVLACIMCGVKGGMHPSFPPLPSSDPSFSFPDKLRVLGGAVSCVSVSVQNMQTNKLGSTS